MNLIISDFPALQVAQPQKAPPPMTGTAFQIVLANNENHVRSTNTTRTSTIPRSTLGYKQNSNLTTEIRS